MRILFPLSYLSSQLSMTGLLVVLGLTGNSQLAADVGIVQGAALALFFAFSGNARSLIFKSSRYTAGRTLFLVRAVLILPLCVGVYYLGSVVGGVSYDIALILIARKSIEWLTEIHLSEVERDQNTIFARWHLVLQSVLLLLVVVWTLSGWPGFLLVLAAWALIPLIISLPRLQTLFHGARSTGLPVVLLFPHLGSSSVMGIGVYVFRLVILLLVGKATAGDLFTAFAIGGILGSVFATGVGPSVVLHEHRTGKRYTPKWLRATLVTTTLMGMALVFAFQLVPDSSAFMGKDLLFWNAVGLSLIGGVVMVLAQKQRLRDLQNGTEEDVFAPDVLVSILIVISVPIIFIAFGRDGLSWLYLFNAGIALAFYWMTDPARAEWVLGKKYADKLRTIIALLLVSPVFLTLQEGLFRSDILNYESGGNIGRLPIPISVLGCYIGIILFGNYKRANLGLMVIFSTFALMVLSTVTTTTYGTDPDTRAKILLLFQFLLPMFGLVLGMTYEDLERGGHVLEKSIVLVTAVLVPMQLLASWMQGLLWLSPYLYLFSIYQHLQYVPVILIGCYLVATYTLWEQPQWRRLTMVLAPAVGVYAAATASIRAIALLVAGSIAFGVSCVLIRKAKGDWRQKWTWTGLVLIALAAYFEFMQVIPEIVPNVAHASTGWYLEKFDPDKLPNVQGRVETWLFYMRGIVDDTGAFLLGHRTPPDRLIMTSAHNSYLDFIYNFGSVAVLAIAGLIAYTVIQLVRHRRRIMTLPSMLGLSIVVIFLLLVDNMLTVAMRQPYSGVFTFFLWGLLLTRFKTLKSQKPTPDIGGRFAR